MLDAGLPAVEAMTEYARASGQLGHAVPDPARLHAAYTAEDGLDLHALEADHRTLAQAVVAVEEALLVQDDARLALAAAWRGAGAQAAADRLMRHAQAAEAGVEGLRAATAAVGELRDRLWQLIDAKVNVTRDVEARGSRAQWLGAARTVTTGAGDRSDASETVDLQVAPFVANDIALDWLPTMCDTESAVRQAYRDAIAAMTTEASAGFGGAALDGPTPVGAEQNSLPAGSGTAGFAPGGAAPGPAAAAQLQPVAAPAAAAVDPMASAPGAPLGWGMSSMSGLSGLGQSFADILGGLFGAGGQGLGESLSGDGEFDASEMDAPADPEIDDHDEDDEDDEDATEDPEDEESAGDETSPEETDEAVPAGDPAVPAPPPPAPEPAAPTPVPEPPAEPMAAPALDATTEPVPAETPCEIAADALPQAGP